LTEVERAALRGETVARWADHVLEMRLRICCRAIGESSQVDPTTMAQTIQVCREIGEASPRDDASLLQYTKIRSSLLKMLGMAPHGLRNGTEELDLRADNSPRRTVPIGTPEVLSEFAPSSSHRSPRAAF
jgi:hypothetical protein